MNIDSVLNYSKTHRPLLSRDKVKALATDIQKMRALGKRKERNAWAAENNISVEELDRIVKKGTRSHHHLVESNLRLVTYVISRNPNLVKGVDPDDAFQDGCLGLHKAARYFHPDYEVEFSTFACPCIRQYLAQAHNLRANDYVVFGTKFSNTLKNMAKVRKAWAQLSRGLGRNPNSQELSEQSGLSVQEVVEIQDMLRASMPSYSLNTPVKGLSDDSVELLEFIESPYDEDCEEEQDELYRMVSLLEPALQSVIRMTYGLGGTKPMTTNEMAAALGLSRNIVRHNLAKGLRALKHHYRTENLLA